jgi:hypothetical protein
VLSSFKDFWGNESYEFSVPTLRAACFAHIMCFDIITLKVFVEEYES